MTETSERVLVYAPRGRDGELTCAMLEAQGIHAIRCADGRTFLAALRDGAGCAVITSEVVDPWLHDELGALLAAQPPWSDFPVLVLTSGHGAARDSLFELGNMTILERPVAPATLLIAVRAALRARRRQYDGRAAILMRDQFLAMLGHELRNPLAAIVLASEIRTTNPRDVAALVNRLAMIARQSSHLCELVDDLLDVARVTSGKVQLRRQAVDLDATVREAVEALAGRAHQRRIEVIVPPGCGVVIEGDQGRLGQVFGNLISNAIKYSPAGSTVLISAERQGDWCEVRVCDRGIGIASDVLPRIFELFVQADATLDRSEGGLGVGLALVQRLVQLHGGTVTVSSAGLGHGSEFIVRLPVGHPPHVEPEVTQPATGFDRPIRVVIVEDNLDLLELTQGVLEELGCTTATASDGEAGLACILAGTSDLALIDVGLPKLDGFSLVRSVRERLAHPPTLVAVTGYGQTSDRERALASGFDEHVTKPVESRTLRALVDRTRAKLSQS